MILTFEQLKDLYLKEVKGVYQIFSNFFGEEHVDLKDVKTDDTIKEEFVYWKENDQYVIDEKVFNAQKAQNSYNEPCHILVWWPEVTVTNEYDESILIQDLFAKVPLLYTGKLYVNFKMQRTTYTESQFISCYKHSHLPRLNYTYSLNTFDNPCLGKGPIKSTQDTLKSTNDPVEWLLFCQELSLYVQTESVQGIPYIRLSSVNNGSTINTHNSWSAFSSVGYSGHDFFQAFDKTTLKNFLLYYLKNYSLKFDYSNGCFGIGMTYQDFRIDVSNAFISYFNHTLKKDKSLLNLVRNTLLERVLYTNKKFYKSGNGCIPNFDEYRGRYLLTFKGENKFLKILREERHENLPILTLLNHSFCLWLYYTFLKVLNYRYINVYARQSNFADDTEVSTTQTSEKVLYL